MQYDPIKIAENAYRLSALSYKCFKKYMLFPDTTNPSNRTFVVSNGLNFEDIVEQQFTGNELLYYPELTLELRKLPEYPILRRHYPFETEQTGLELLNSICNYANEKVECFKVELMSLSKIVSDLVLKHGQERQIPIVGDVHERRWDGMLKTSVDILGVNWCVDGYESKVKAIERLNFYRFLNLSPYEIKFIKLESTKPGTPFIALRLQKEYGQTGRVQWFSLETCKLVLAAEMAKWQRSYKNKISE